MWLSESEMAKNGYQYDGDLLKCLHNVDPNKNNFIVLHLWEVMKIALTVIRMILPALVKR